MNTTCCGRLFVYLLKLKLKHIKLIFYLGAALFLMGCQKSNLDVVDVHQPISKPNACQLLDNGWTVDKPSLVLAEEDEQSIPTIYNPAYFNFDEWPEEWSGDELGIALNISGKLLIAPHRILDKHEILQVDEQRWISLCPLAGTAIGFETPHRLAVSGYLLNSNLMIVKEDKTVFSQMLQQGMSGPGACSRERTIGLMEGSMAFWKDHHPEALVLSTETGYGKKYAGPPFSQVVQEEATLFYSVDAISSKFNNYHYMHGILFNEEDIKVYSSKLFKNGPVMILDFTDAPILIIGDKSLNWYTSYYLEDDMGIHRDFEINKHDGVITLKDLQTSTTWNVWGEAIDGPGAGAKLIPTQNHNGFWYAFYAMYQDALEVYVEDKDE